MKVHGLSILNDFTNRYAEARDQVNAWLAEVERAEWKGPLDIKQRYRSASFLSDNRAIFNIKGTKFRIAVQVSYKHQIVLVLRCGSHAEYSKWKF